MEKMEKVLRQALLDAEAYEMMKAYDVEKSFHYEFEKRSDDFYITLISRMLRLMDELETVDKAEDIDSIKTSLAEVARGLIVYSERYTSRDFKGVNKTNNHLFVAAIYYVCGYEAIASLLLRGYKLRMYHNKASQQLFYIITGCRIEEDEDAIPDAIEWVDEYVRTGNEELLHETVRALELSVYKNAFDTLREYFDSTILLHVLKKFETSNIWTDLKHFAPDTDWTEYIVYSKGEHILSFLPSQRAALENGLLSFRQSFSLGLATSGGKSYITELLIYQELKQNPMRKVLYLAPLRSLSRELKERFRKVGKKLNIKCACKYGGNVLDDGDASLEEAQLLVATPETFITLEGVLDEELRSFSLVICDEGQLLDDWSRGINYELLLTRLKKQGQKRFLFLSAIIPNIEDINCWLGGEETQVGKSTYRPCEIRYGVLRTGEGAIHADIWNRTYSAVSYTIPEFVNAEFCKGNNLGSKTGITCLSALKALKAGPVMVYSSTKYNNVGCVTICKKINELVTKIPALIPAQYTRKAETLNELKDYVTYQMGEDYPLVAYIGNGFSYHHADLPQDIREAIENAYERGVLPLIVSTSTLAEGVNMPIKTLILHNLLSPLSFNPPRFMDISSIKNIVGRVGRAGRQKYGVVLVPESEKGIAEDLTRKALKSGTLAPIHGMLYDLIEVLNKLKWQEASLERINKLLESEGLAEGIDLMISRNLGDVKLEDIQIEDVCQSSLAYKLGSEDDRAMLSKVFAARFESIKALADSGEYDDFLETGLALNSYHAISDRIRERDSERMDALSEANQAEFMPYLVDLMKSVGLFDEGSNVGKFVNTSLLFMQGDTYSKIADSLKIDVDEVLQYTNYLQNMFAENVRAVIRYVVRKYEVKNLFLDEWPDYLKYGLYTSFEYELYTKRLSDRIAVHAVEEYVQKELHANAADVMFLKIYPERLLHYISEKGYPSVTISKVRRWLYS